MKFDQKLKLLGVVGKKGSGTLDNGNQWSTDRVELHCLSKFDDSDSMSVGNTVVVHNIEDYASNFDKAKSLVGKDVLVSFDLIAAKKIGQAPKLIARTFSSAS